MKHARKDYNERIQDSANLIPARHADLMENWANTNGSKPADVPPEAV